MRDRVAHFINNAWQLGDEIPDTPSSIFNEGWIQIVFNIVVPIILAIMCFIIIRSMFHVNFEYERSVILRLGRFKRVAGPGLFMRIPIFDKILKTVSIYDQVTKLNVEQSLTQDTVAVTVTTVVIWKIIDPQKAVLDIEDYDDAVLQTAQSAMREAIGSHSLADLLNNRSSMDAHIKTVLDKRTLPWGIQIQSVDIQDVTIPAELQDSMSRLAQATQEGLARQRLAESEMAIALLTTEAATIYDKSPTALKLRQMGLVYEMGQNSNTILVPTDMASCMASAIALTKAI